MDRNNADLMKKMQYILNMRPVLNTEALFSDGSDYYRWNFNGSYFFTQIFKNII